MVAIDTETTGLGSKDRIIEFGAIEIIGRKLGRRYSQRINPQMEIKEDATKIHGITNADVAGEPMFVDVIDDFLAFVGKADLIGHNLGFDVRMVNREVKRLGLANKYTTSPDFDFEVHVRQDPSKRSDHSDTMKMARTRGIGAGKGKSLDALCDILEIDRSQRKEHGALLDAELAALCYLAITRGTGDIFKVEEWKPPEIRRLNRTDPSKPDYIGPLKVVRATPEEINAHVDTCAWLATETFRKNRNVV
jgi:DNA polymerase-3 subunit epsilon